MYIDVYIRLSGGLLFSSHRNARDTARDVRVHTWRCPKMWVHVGTPKSSIDGFSILNGSS